MYCDAHSVWHCQSRNCIGWYRQQNYSYPGMPSFGFDVTDGDPVMNLGNGLGVDLATGELELQIAPGIDIPLD